MSTARFLRRCSAFSKLDESTLAGLAGASHSRQLNRGEKLWSQGDLAEVFTVIRGGLVKVVRGGSRRTLCGIFGPPDSVGDVALLRGLPYPADAVVASAQVETLEIPGELVLSLAQRQPQLGLSMACGTHQKLENLHRKIDVLSAGNVEARVATLLLDLYERFGDEFDDGESHVMVALSRRELAECVSTSPETAIRLMTRWEREGIVSTTPDGFVLHDLERLRGTAG